MSLSKQTWLCVLGITCEGQGQRQDYRRCNHTRSSAWMCSALHTFARCGKSREFGRLPTCSSTPAACKISRARTIGKGELSRRCLQITTCVSGFDLTTVHRPSRHCRHLCVYFVGLVCCACRRVSVHIYAYTRMCLFRSRFHATTGN